MAGEGGGGVSRGFVSPELEAAWEFLDRLIQANRRTAGKADGHGAFISQLVHVRNDIETADMAIDNNSPMRGDE
jgi:hypothetical protein